MATAVSLRPRAVAPGARWKGVAPDEHFSAKVVAAVAAVPDPELAGVTIGDLGMVVSVRVAAPASSGALPHVDVTLVATFLGCPALALIADDVRDALRGAGAAASSTVTFTTTVAWTPTRVAPAARARLAELGIGTAHACPACGSADLQAVSPVGATACRSLHWCTACRTPIELLRTPGR